jgi:Abnormal spindle-like microcephaly-assoc'd, ASPM-SPD-2-Hydin
MTTNSAATRATSTNRWCQTPGSRHILGWKPAVLVMIFTAVLCVLSDAGATTSTTISYVQGNDATPQSPQTTVKVTFTAAQTAGDLNVVVVGWFNTTPVGTVTDSSGNTYTLAVGPTTTSSSPWPIWQSIYYAKNIAAAGAGTNSVTVTFSTAAQYPDIRILEYNGVDPNNPVDITASNSGSSTMSSSGSATTTNATDLLFGANMVDTNTTGPGSGFTRRLLTAYRDIAEDQMVTIAGSYSATAPLRSSGPWIMQMVAFRTPSAGGDPPTYLLSASPASLSFGNTRVGTQTVLPIILTNTGTGTVTITQATITGTGFSGSGISLPLTLSPGQNTDLSITFAPTAGGSVTGSASVVSNASNSPGVVSLSGTGAHCVDLSWTGSTSSGVTGYNIYRGATSSGPYTQLNSSLITGTSYTDSSVVAGQTYYYVTTAVNSSGVQSGYSNQAQAQVPSP